MSKNRDGGPAFPFPSNDGPGEFPPSRGMTLRDWFAGMALSGLCSNPGGPYQANGMNGWDLVNCDHQHVAREAYLMADAMLAECAKGGS